MKKQVAFRLAELVFKRKGRFTVTLTKEHNENCEMFIDVAGKFNDTLEPLFALLKKENCYWCINEKLPVLEVYHPFDGKINETVE